MTPEQFLAFRTATLSVIHPLQLSIRKAWELSQMCEPPSQRRPAEPTDIVVGAVIWYENDDRDGWYWREVFSVLKPDSEFKAYEADDGCRYGLDGAWVRMG